MKLSVITTKTITYAQKAKKALSKKGIDVKIIKLDSIEDQNGCIYGIQYHERYFYDIIATLKELGIPYSTTNKG